MDKANEIVVSLTDKYQTSISNMVSTDLDVYLKSLKTHLRDDTNTFNRLMFLYSLKDLTKEKYVELLINTEHEESKVVHYQKSKLDAKTQEIVKVDMVHYDLYHDDMRLSDMIREKGFLVSANVTDKDTTETLIVKINAQNQQIDSIVNGMEEIKPIQAHHKEFLKGVKERSISDRYEHLNKIDKNIALLRYKIAFVVLEISKRVHANKTAVLERLQGLKDMYNFKPTVTKSTTTADGVKIVNGVEHHTHEGIKGYHKTTTEHKNKQLHEFK